MRTELERVRAEARREVEEEAARGATRVERLLETVEGLIRDKGEMQGVMEAQAHRVGQMEKAMGEMRSQ